MNIHTKLIQVFVLPKFSAVPALCSGTFTFRKCTGDGSKTHFQQKGLSSKIAPATRTRTVHVERERERERERRR